jgi:hypothetical protein
VGSPIQAGLEAGVAHLLDALGHFCDAEGLAASDLHSINRHLCHDHQGLHCRA